MTTPSIKEALTDIAAISACVAVVENPTSHIKMLSKINAISVKALKALATLSQPTADRREIVARAVTAELEQMRSDGFPMLMREGKTTWRTYHAGFDLSMFASRLSDVILAALNDGGR